MPIKNYHPSEFVAKQYKTTSISTPEDSNGCSYDFRIQGNVMDEQEFIDRYIQERIQMWNDFGYDNGIWSKDKDNGYQNLMKTLDENNYVFQHINWESTHRVPAWGTCCGHDIELSAFTNTCHDCGSDYNSGGQLLAPRYQWGEETGEHWSDCY